MEGQIQEWCTIESDPGVFTELISDLGVKGIAVEEIYSLDDQDLLTSLKPIHGLIFLFKWQKNPEKRQCLDYYDQDLFFANQVIPNACATQAILSVLLNANIDLGEDLLQFKSFCQGLDSQTRGWALNDSENIKTVHNSFARPEPFIVSHDKKSKKGDAFHFVSFVPFKGKLYELDGLQTGPILLGECSEENWIDLASAEINTRIQKYSENEIRFTLLAICRNKKEIATEEMNKLLNMRANLFSHLVNNHSDELEHDMLSEATEMMKEVKSGLSLASMNTQYTKADILAKIQEINANIANTQLILQDENDKFNRYHAENLRRKHNYIPFIIELLKLTAKKGKLKELVDAAKVRFEAKLKAKDEKEKQTKQDNKKQKQFNQ